MTSSFVIVLLNTLSVCVISADTCADGQDETSLIQRSAGSRRLFGGDFPVPDCNCEWITHDACTDNYTPCGQACCACSGTMDCNCGFECGDPDGTCCNNKCCGTGPNRPHPPAPAPLPDCNCEWITHDACTDNYSPCGQACCACSGTMDCNCDFECGGDPDGTCCNNKCCGTGPNRPHPPAPAPPTTKPPPTNAPPLPDCNCEWMTEDTCKDNFSVCGQACCACSGTMDCNCDFECGSPDGTCCNNKCCGTGPNRPHPPRDAAVPTTEAPTEAPEPPTEAPAVIIMASAVGRSQVKSLPDCNCQWITPDACTDNHTPCGQACCACSGTMDCTCGFNCGTPDGTCCNNKCCGTGPNRPHP